jgi:MoaA/NifB/PqqE/SkfB family radical SAM enzyme
MFNFHELNAVQIEISNKCQASCPMCSRNVRGGLPNENLVEAEWTLEGFKRIFDEEVLGVVKKIIFCGCYGDPMMNNDFIEMVRYTRSINKDLFITINTNGGARNNDWWAELARVLENKNHIVVFGIDGLEDTHHLYRIGTTYQRVVDHAKAFIDAGGSAEWQFILFKHNEHQIEEARARSKEVGFIKFTLIDTYRFILGSRFDVYNRNNQITHSLEKSDKSSIKEFKVEMVKNYKSILNSVTIDCEAKRQKDAYIDAFYHMYPCCYIAGSIYNSDRYNEPLPGNDEEAKISWRSGHLELRKQINSLVDSLGGHDAINVYKRGFKAILEEGAYGEAWSKQWIGEDKNLQCSAICGKNTAWSNSDDQFKHSLIKET